MKPPLAKLYPCILMNIFINMQIINSKNIHSTHLLIIISPEWSPHLPEWQYFPKSIHEYILIFSCTYLDTWRLNSYMYISNIFISTKTFTSKNISCTDLDTRMAPAELRVPEAMIALDLWLPAVQEVIIRNCYNQVLYIINLAIKWGSDCPRPLVACRSRGYY